MLNETPFWIKKFNFKSLTFFKMALLEICITYEVISL